MATIKLVIQPIVENAIYHAMEYMDGDGEMMIRAFLENEQVIIEVEDNGPGIPPERILQLVKGEAVTSTRRGSGIGVKNVRDRIQLQFGSQYGLNITSELDEGTCVRINMPAILYENWEED